MKNGNIKMENDTVKCKKSDRHSHFEMRKILNFSL